MRQLGHSFFTPSHCRMQRAQNEWEQLRDVACKRQTIQLNESIILARVVYFLQEMQAQVLASVFSARNTCISLACMCCVFSTRDTSISFGLCTFCKNYMHQFGMYCVFSTRDTGISFNLCTLCRNTQCSLWNGSIIQRVIMTLCLNFLGVNLQF